MNVILQKYKLLNLCVAVGLMFFALSLLSPVHAQDSEQEPRIFSTKVRAASTTVLLVNNKKLSLWGTEEIEAAPALLKLKARTALDNIIKDGQVECEIKNTDSPVTQAQCINKEDIDLGLFMIQNGYVTVDRTAIYNTVYEQAYVQAETEAQNNAAGIWGGPELENSGRAKLVGGLQTAALAIFVSMILAFGALSFMIMRGFRHVIDAQNDNIQTMIEERRLRLKEREIVGTMLESELKTNKSKIEAHLVVYEEMMRDLLDKTKEPAYKKAGDIIQIQPSLDRTVFDRNADKIDVLGRELSSALIHFYARIKHNPDFQNIEPDTSLEDAIALVEKTVENSHKLNDRANQLLSAFEENDIISSEE